MAKFGAATLSGALALLIGPAALAQSTVPPAGAKPQDTEQWTPTPVVVTPGATSDAPPSDALVLFRRPLPRPVGPDR